MFFTTTRKKSEKKNYSNPAHKVPAQMCLQKKMITDFNQKVPMEMK